MDCPQITSATSDDITLSYDEKLELIEKEALSLYEYCLTKKFSTNQVRECIGPLNGQRKSVITRLVAGSATTVVYLSVLVAITAALWKWPTANKILTANAKILSVKVSWRLGFKRKHFLKQLHHITYIKKCMIECILT